MESPISNIIVISNDGVVTLTGVVRNYIKKHKPKIAPEK
jgi:osmotically-inducible protein OsmY